MEIDTPNERLHSTFGIVYDDLYARYWYHLVMTHVVDCKSTYLILPYIGEHLLRNYKFHAKDKKFII